MPFGYRKGDDSLLEVVQEEAVVLSRAFEMYAAGNYTDQMIATWLNQTEHKPRARTRDWAERNYIWTRDSVKDLLTNAFYLGMVKYKGELLTVNTPRLSHRGFSTLPSACGNRTK